MGNAPVCCFRDGLWPEAIEAVETARMPRARRTAGRLNIFGSLINTMEYELQMSLVERDSLTKAETGVRRETGGRSQRSEVRGQKSEVRGQRSEVRGQTEYGNRSMGREFS